MTESELFECPKCGAKLPLFNEKGQHNFCPTLWEDSKTVDGVWHPQKIIEICMKCKMEEVVEKWRRDKTH